MTFTQLVAEYFEVETLTIQFNTLRSLTVAPLELLFLGLLQRNLLFLHTIILATVSMILRVTALTKGLTGVFSMRGVLNGEALLLTLFEISHRLIVLWVLGLELFVRFNIHWRVVPRFRYEIFVGAGALENFLKVFGEQSFIGSSPDGTILNNIEFIGVFLQHHQIENIGGSHFPGRVPLYAINSLRSIRLLIHNYTPSSQPSHKHSSLFNLNLQFLWYSMIASSEFGHLVEELPYSTLQHSLLFVNYLLSWSLLSERPNNLCQQLHRHHSAKPNHHQLFYRFSIQHSHRALRSLSGITHKLENAGEAVGVYFVQCEFSLNRVVKLR